jgi:tripartite-type tricarboxylate transporter receptor subunit TctC
MAEAGVPGVEVASWSAFLVPAKTPREAIDKIRADTVKALAVPSVKQKLEAGGVVIKGSTPAELAAFLDAELEKWGRVIKAANIRPE